MYEFMYHYKTNIFISTAQVQNRMLLVTPKGLPHAPCPSQLFY